MNRSLNWGLGLTLCLLAGTCACAADLGVPSYITAAVADGSRPDRDRARDVNRKPEQVLAFAGVKPGDQIGELMPGGGYYTRLLCQIAGPAGHVYTLTIQRVDTASPPPPDVGAPAPAATPCTNVSSDSRLATAAALPAGLDLVWTSENYHDLHNAMFGSPDMKAFDTVVFNALKPGGVFIVEDHAAAAGSGARDTATLHRIDPEQVRQEVTGVGFVLEASSDLLRNPADAHDVKVFALAGKSDKFLLKFRKPKG